MLNWMRSQQSWQHLENIRWDERTQDIYQKKVDQAFDKCKGTFAIADDIQVYGIDINHDIHLHEAVERTREAKCKLNYD